MAQTTFGFIQIVLQLPDTNPDCNTVTGYLDCNAVTGHPIR